jgi:hypothetical protein
MKRSGSLTPGPISCLHRISPCPGSDLSPSSFPTVQHVRMIRAVAGPRSGRTRRSEPIVGSTRGHGVGEGLAPREAVALNSPGARAARRAGGGVNAPGPVLPLHGIPPCRNRLWASQNDERLTFPPNAAAERR